MCPARKTKFGLTCLGQFTKLLSVNGERNSNSHERCNGKNMRYVNCFSITVLMAVAVLTTGCHSTWQDKLTEQLPIMGHRNWLVVADSAYPMQTRPGIETIATGQKQLDLVKAVLEAVDNAPHVRAVIYLDRELKAVPEKNAPGINQYRKELNLLLQKHTVVTIPHEQLIAKLDEDAKIFHVLILKTNMTLPYTSVFIQLDCGYWSGEAEKQLREKINQ